MAVQFAPIGAHYKLYWLVARPVAPIGAHQELHLVQVAPIGVHQGLHLFVAVLVGLIGAHQAELHLLATVQLDPIGGHPPWLPVPGLAAPIGAHQKRPVQELLPAAAPAL